MSDMPAVQPNLPLAEAMAILEKQIIQAALTHTHHHIGKAAQELNISRMTLHRKIKKYQLMAID